MSPLLIREGGQSQRPPINIRQMPKPATPPRAKKPGPESGGADYPSGRPVQPAKDGRAS